MVRFLSLLTTVATVCTTLALAQASNDNPNGKILYVNYPSCSYYRCQVTWTAGSANYVNWLNAPKGGLRIQLEPQDGTTGLQTYTLTDKVGSVHGWSDHKCDNMGTGEKCGRFDFTLPSNVKPGLYQIVVTSLAHPNKYVGYTDTVKVVKAKSGKGKRHEMERLQEDQS
ncbi:ATP-dependent RNA helicase DBP5 [Pseudozyma hubeiensis]|nr:ATP-dependent RNA helicase DBP5 [Pseudozyma hubeiensis]